MDPTKLKWHHFFNWPRILTIICVVVGAVFIGVAVHNATGIRCAAAAVAAINAGSDPLTAAASAGPADTQQNWLITYGTTAIGVLSMLVGLLKAWQATAGQSTVARLTKTIQSVEPQAGETVEVLLAKIKALLAAQQTASLQELVEKGQ